MFAAEAAPAKQQTSVASTLRKLWLIQSFRSTRMCCHFQWLIRYWKWEKGEIAFSLFRALIIHGRINQSFLDIYPLESGKNLIIYLYWKCICIESLKDNSEHGLIKEMDANTRTVIRLPCKACRYEIVSVNGEEPDQSLQRQGIIDNPGIRSWTQN